MFIVTIKDIVQLTILALAVLMFGGLFLYIKFVGWQEKKKKKKRE